jgi:hypothetical protein
MHKIYSLTLIYVCKLHKEEKIYIIKINTFFLFLGMSLLFNDYSQKNIFLATSQMFYQNNNNNKKIDRYLQI